MKNILNLHQTLSSLWRKPFVAHTEANPDECASDDDQIGTLPADGGKGKKDKKHKTLPELPGTATKPAYEKLGELAGALFGSLFPAPALGAA